MWQSHEWNNKHQSGSQSQESPGSEKQWNSPKGQDIVLLENDHTDLKDSESMIIEV